MANISAGWPEGVAGAVSLSFDDGSQSQLDIALPILEEYGLLGTFYINPSGEDWLERLAPWRDASQRGHEIGNHTVEHICCRNYSPSPDRKSLESSTLDEIEADVAEADQRLDALLPERPARTFCYPCYQSYVGEGSTRQSYVPVIARRFPAARGRGEAANEPALTDLHYLSSWPVAGWMSGEQLCGFAGLVGSVSCLKFLPGFFDVCMLSKPGSRPTTHLLSEFCVIGFCLLLSPTSVLFEPPASFGDPQLVPPHRAADLLWRPPSISQNKFESRI